MYRVKGLGCGFGGLRFGGQSLGSRGVWGGVSLRMGRGLEVWRTRV